MEDTVYEYQGALRLRDIAPSPDEDKETALERLFKLVADLKRSYEISDRVTEIEVEPSETLPGNRAIGVQERSYILLGTDNGTEVEFAGSEGFTSCIGLSLYARDRRKLLIAHFTIGTEPQEVHKLFKELEDSITIEVRIFGGPESSSELERDRDTSYQLAKEIVYEMYLFATSSIDKDIYILSSDIFDDVSEMRKNREEKGSPFLSVGFAIEVSTGNILCNEGCPYGINFENFGLYDQKYKAQGVWTMAHTAMQYPGSELVKHYDNYNKGWNEEHEIEIENKCKAGIVNLFIRLLIEYFFSRTKISFAASEKALFNKLYAEELLAMLRDISIHEKSFKESFLAFILVKVAHLHEEYNCEPYDNEVPASDNYTYENAHPLYKIFSLGIFQKRFLIHYLLALEPTLDEHIEEALLSFTGVNNLKNDIISFFNHKRSWSSAYENIVALIKRYGGEIELTKSLISKWKEKIIEDFLKDVIDYIILNAKIEVSHKASPIDNIQALINSYLSKLIDQTIFLDALSLNYGQFRKKLQSLIDNLVPKGHPDDGFSFSSFISCTQKDTLLYLERDIVEFQEGLAALLAELVVICKMNTLQNSASAPEGYEALEEILQRTEEEAVGSSIRKNKHDRSKNDQRSKRDTTTDKDEKEKETTSSSDSESEDKTLSRSLG